jgi:hypothetical protein
MKILIIIILTLTPMAAYARGHGGHGGGGPRIDYHFPPATHYAYHPFNPRSY